MDQENRVSKFRRNKIANLYGVANDLVNFIGEVESIIHEASEWRQHYQGITDDLNAEYWDEGDDSIHYNEMNEDAVADYIGAYEEVIVGLQDSIKKLKRMVEFRGHD
jgi:hypothetical protein